MNIEAYDPLQDLVPAFIWATGAIKQFRGTSDEQRFREMAGHLEREIRKYSMK